MTNYDDLLARADSAAKSLKDMGMGAFIADLAAALRAERAARERAEAELADLRRWVGPKPGLSNAETGAVASCRRLLDTVDVLRHQLDAVRRAMNEERGFGGGITARGEQMIRAALTEEGP